MGSYMLSSRAHLPETSPNSSCRLHMGMPLTVCPATFSLVHAAGAWVCLDANQDVDHATFCRSQYSSCKRSPAVVWAIGWFFLFFLSWVPCCYFCCCSRGPKEADYEFGAQVNFELVLRCAFSLHQQEHIAILLVGCSFNH